MFSCSTMCMEIFLKQDWEHLKFTVLEFCVHDFHFALDLITTTVWLSLNTSSAFFTIFWKVFGGITQIILLTMVGLIFQEELRRHFLKHSCSHFFISLSYAGWDMTPAVFLIILCLGVVPGASALDLSLDVQWQEWKIKYEKSYSPVGIPEGPRSKRV